MIKKNKLIWVVPGSFLLISFASELTRSVKDVGLPDTLLSFFVLVGLVLAARYWIIKSRKQ